MADTSPPLLTSSLSSWPGPRNVFLQRTENVGFGFTLRHFIVYPPETLQKGQNSNIGDEKGLQSSPLNNLGPMDTIFVKHVKEGGPAHRAGLATGDRIVSVNGETITGKSYPQVVQLIQKSGSTLQLLVVPKEDDILQLYFPGTAYHVDADGHPILDSASAGQCSDLCPSQDLQSRTHQRLTSTLSSSSLDSGVRQWRNQSGLSVPSSHPLGIFTSNSDSRVSGDTRLSEEYRGNHQRTGGLYSGSEHTYQYNRDSSSLGAEPKSQPNGNTHDLEYARSKSSSDLIPPSLKHVSSSVLPGRSGSADGIPHQPPCQYESFSSDSRSYQQHTHARDSESYHPHAEPFQDAYSRSLPTYDSFMGDPTRRHLSKCSNISPYKNEPVFTSSDSVQSSDAISSRDRFFQFSTPTTTPTTSSTSSREPSTERFTPYSIAFSDRTKNFSQRKEEFTFRPSPYLASSTYHLPSTTTTTNPNVFRLPDVNSGVGKEYCAQPQKLGQVWPPKAPLQRTGQWQVSENEQNSFNQLNRNDNSPVRNKSSNNSNLNLNSPPLIVYSSSDSLSSSSYASNMNTRTYGSQEAVDNATEDTHSSRFAKPFVSTLGRIQENISSSSTVGGCGQNSSVDKEKVMAQDAESVVRRGAVLSPLRKANSLDSDVPHSARPNENKRIMQLQLVSQRTRQFESGSIESDAKNRMNLYRNELSRLTAKGQTPSVSVRAAQFESRSTSQETLGSEGDEMLTPRQRTSLEFKREGSREFRWQRSYSDNTSYNYTSSATTSSNNANSGLPTLSSGTSLHLPASSSSSNITPNKKSSSTMTPSRLVSSLVAKLQKQEGKRTEVSSSGLPTIQNLSADKKVSALAAKLQLRAQAASGRSDVNKPLSDSSEPLFTDEDDDDDDEFRRRRAVRQNSYLQAVRSPYRDASPSSTSELNHPSPSSYYSLRPNVPTSLPIAIVHHPVVPQDGSIPAPPTPSNGLGPEPPFACQQSLLHELRSTDFGSLFEEGSISRLIAAFDNMLAGAAKAKPTLSSPGTASNGTSANVTSTASLSAHRSTTGVILRKKAIYEDELQGTRRTSYLKATSKERMHGELEADAGDEDQTDGKLGTPAGNRSHSIQKLKAFFGERTPQIVEATEKHMVKELPSPIYDVDVVKEGWLHCKVAFLDGKRSADRSWKQLWACLRSNALYLFKDKKDSHQLPLCLEEQPIVIRPSTVEVAHDYTKKKNVFRLMTPNNSQYLLQAEYNEDMMHWIRLLQEHQNAENQGKEAGSHHLIVRRFDQQGGEHISCLSPQPVQKGIKKLTSFRNRSPTGHSPTSKNRKSTQGDDLSPKAKTWRGKMVKTIKKIHGTSSTTAAPEGVTICVPLEDCPSSSVSEFVPLLVELCTSIVEARGLEMIGIYRVPGNTAAVTALMDAVNKGFDNLNLQDPRWNDVNVISSVLKAFFRKLPEPLITPDLYPYFIEANKIEDVTLRVGALKKLLHELPDHHYETLKFLIRHLQRIVLHSPVNKMEARNLAIVFGPTIVRAADDNMVTMVTDMSHQCCIVESLITRADWFFSDDDYDDLANQNVPSVDKRFDILYTTSNQNLLLSNIHKVEASGDREICAKEIVSSIISAANRKVRQRAKKYSVCSAPGTYEDAGFEERDIDREVELRRQRVQRHRDSLDPGIGIGTGQRPNSADAKIQRGNGRDLTATKRTVSMDSLNNLQVPGGTSENGGSLESEKMLFLHSANPKRSPSHESLVMNSDKLGDEVVFRTYAGLSASTQERIRRFELETRALLQRDMNRQQKENERRQLERHRIEVEWQRAKQDLEQDDLLDALADNPSDLVSRVANLSTAPHHHDSNSVTSDYSTVSSTTGIEARLATHSQSSGSDYSNNTSPITQHRHNSADADCPPSSLVTSDYNSNTSSPLSTGSSDSRIPADNSIFNRSAQARKPLSSVPFAVLDLQATAAINRQSSQKQQRLLGSPQLLRRRASVENVPEQQQQQPATLSPEKRSPPHEEFSPTNHNNLQRSPSVRYGSLDSLRDFCEGKDLTSCGSSEDTGDLLSSITSSLNHRLRVLLDPGSCHNPPKHSSQSGCEQLSKDVVTATPSTPQAERRQRYRDPSLHRTRESRIMAEEMARASAQKNHNEEKKGERQCRSEQRQTITPSQRAAERKTATSELRLTVDGKQIKPVSNGKVESRVVKSAPANSKSQSDIKKSPNKEVSSRESKGKRIPLSVDVKKAKEAERKSLVKQSSSDASPVEVKVHRNESTLITATVSTTKHTVTTSATTAVITATIISKSEKTRSNLKDKAKDQAKRPVVTSRSADCNLGSSVKEQCSNNKDKAAEKCGEPTKTTTMGKINADEKDTLTPPILRKNISVLRNLKRRHTVGGTKDFDQFRLLLGGILNRKDTQLSAWDRLQPAVQESPTDSQQRTMKSWLERERLRTSSPDLMAAQLSPDSINTDSDDHNNSRLHFDRRRRMSFPETQLASLQLAKIVTLESRV